MKVLVFCLLACTVLLLPQMQAAVIASSNFDTNTEGWGAVTADPNNAYAIQATPALVYNATGGNPGGYVSVADPDNFDTMFSGSGAFQGNLLAALEGTLRYDITTDQSADYNGADVVIKGNGTTLVYDTGVPTAGIWTTVTLSLAPNASWHLTSTGGATPTLADFHNALANVTFFAITAEYHNGLGEISGLDNVSLSGNAPEPSTFGLVIPVFGIAACGWLRRRYSR